MLLGGALGRGVVLDAGRAEAGDLEAGVAPGFEVMDERGAAHSVMPWGARHIRKLVAGLAERGFDPTPYVTTWHTVGSMAAG